MIWSLTRAMTSSTIVPPNGDACVDACGTAGALVEWVVCALARFPPPKAAPTKVAKRATPVGDVREKKTGTCEKIGDCENLNFIGMNISRGNGALTLPGPTLPAHL